MPKTKVVEKKVERNDIPKYDALGKGDHKAVILRSIPHSRNSFTQGLYYKEGRLIESTGKYGSSKINVIDASNGDVIQSKKMGYTYFGEGLTELNNKYYVLTWKRGTCLVYDPGSLDEIGRFNYDGEGWGITDDGNLLIMSNGSEVLKFIDPNSFNIVKQIQVQYKGVAQSLLNELEYVNGEIFANVWGEDILLRIDPKTGEVLGQIKLDFLFNEIEIHADMDVLNGIAYDPRKNTYYVTGKNWDKIFEIKLETI